MYKYWQVIRVNMTQISFDAKQTNPSSKSFSILGAALRVPLIHNKTSLRIINDR